MSDYQNNPQLIEDHKQPQVAAIDKKEKGAPLCIFEIREEEIEQTKELSSEFEEARVFISKMNRAVDDELNAALKWVEFDIENTDSGKFGEVVVTDRPPRMKMNFEKQKLWTE